MILSMQCCLLGYQNTSPKSIINICIDWMRYFEPRISRPNKIDASFGSRVANGSEVDTSDFGVQYSEGPLPAYQDLGAERSEWLLTGAGSKIANNRLERAKRSSAEKLWHARNGPHLPPQLANRSFLKEHAIHSRAGFGMAPSLALQILLHPAGNPAGIHGAGLAGHFLPFVEQDDQRNAADLEPAADVLMLFGVELGKAHLRRHLH